MRSEARLDSAVFQLTPTRTRCDLVIVSNGKTEKIASGLLNPFVSHLKTAQDQIAKGGYSIKLEPDPDSQASWFTKGTVERFVRFVSTPEVLERVNTIESEILQIEEAISSHGNDNLGLSTVEEQLKSFGSSEGNMQMRGADTEKAIVLRKTGSQPNPPVSNESKMHEENSKVQLVRVLESRKKVLQKEQAMAFARTAAAGFEMENMVHLLSFAEFFGASRLREACSRYMQLWEGKHESGQWIEVEAAEALSYRSEFPSLNTSGIIFSEDAMKQKEFIEAWPASGRDVGENNGNMSTQDNDRDKTVSSEVQLPHGQPVYQAQIQHPSFPQWPMHSQPSPYFFQPYPMQAMPHYQNPPVDGQFPHPPYSPMEDPKLNSHQSKGKKQHSNYSKDGSSHSDDGTGQNTSEYEEEPSRVRRSHKKAGHSGKKKGVVVIRNLNYIAAKRLEKSGNKSESSSDSEIDDIKDMLFDHGGTKHKPSGSLKREDNHQETTEFSNVHGKDEEIYIEEADAGNWQAFQSFLLEAEENMTSAVDGDVFSGEKKPPVKKAQNKDGPDPILLSTRNFSNFQESFMEYDAFSGKGSRTKQAVSTDEFLISTEGRVHLNSQIDAQFKEIDVGVGGYRKVVSDDFIMYGLEKQMPNKISSDPLVDFEHENGTKFDQFSSPNVTDESFVVPFRLGTLDQLGVDTRFAIDMDSEFRSTPQKEDDFSREAANRISYEPDDLTLILEHTRESESVGYNQTVDSDIQVPLIVKQESKNEEDVVSESINEGFIKTHEVKLKSPKSELEKKRKDTTMRKTTSMRSSPLSEAQKRAEKLRNYKSDLQKQKKEHEEEEIRRLEALKRERQKRIASRNGSKAVQSPPNLQQSNHEKSSNSKNSEIGSNLPPQKLPISNAFNKGIKTTTSNKFSHVASSFLELKESENQEGKSVSARIRRLSEPKGGRVHSVPAKSAITNRVTKKALAEEPGSKNIPDIIHLDETNSETLPDLKVTADRTSSEVLQNKPVTEQQNVAGARIFMTSETHCTEMNPEKNPTLSHIDASHAAIYSSSPIGRVDMENQTEDNQNDPINSFEMGGAAVLNSEKAMNSTETIELSELRSLHQMHETQEKPHNQKGLRKLWKFGRKGHSSHLGDGNLNSCESAVDDDIVVTSNDISRPFSILSPFRGRNNEKKVAASA